MSLSPNPVIDNKKLMYQCLRRGLFGNHFRMFGSLDEAEASGGWVGLRYVGDRPGAPCIPRVQADTVRYVVQGMALHGWQVDRWAFVEVALEEDIMLQGELMQSLRYLELTYSQACMPMRAAFKVDQRFAHGLEAVHLLKRHMDAGSYEDITQLLVDYPDHIVEFTTYRTDHGCFPGRNSVVWELRRY